MRPEHERPTFASQQSLIALPLVVAVATLAAFILRDGFGWGDVLASVVIGIGVFIAIAIIQRLAKR